MPAAAMSSRAVLMAAVAFVAGCASAPAPAPADAFDAQQREAVRNAHTAEGATFEALVVSSYRQPGVRDRLRTCLRADPSVAALAGYLVFLGPGAFRVELRPAGLARDCVMQALENEHLPEPPRYPYQIPFRWPREL
jgi:hypothetical protein